MRIKAIEVMGPVIGWLLTPSVDLARDLAIGLLAPNNKHYTNITHYVSMDLVGWQREQG